MKDRSPPSQRPAKDLAVAERRALSFSSLDAAIEEARRLVDAEEHGRVRTTGNWALGTSLNHLAWWAEEAFTGYRFPLRLRILFALTGPFVKKNALYGTTKPGLRLPGVAGGTLGTEHATTVDGFERFKSAFGRLESECPDRRDVALGRMTHDEWKALHLRHAEHHLSYFHIEHDEPPVTDQP